MPPGCGRLARRDLAAIARTGKSSTRFAVGRIAGRSLVAAFPSRRSRRLAKGALARQSAIHPGTIGENIPHDR
jgi:hypothetical protein